MNTGLSAAVLFAPFPSVPSVPTAGKSEYVFVSVPTRPLAGDAERLVPPRDSDTPRAIPVDSMAPRLDGKRVTHARTARTVAEKAVRTILNKHKG